MKRYYNDPTPDPESDGMPRDMRDCRTLWQRIVGIFKGYNPLPWYWLVLMLWLGLNCGSAFAQHTHEGAVGKFYQSWMMPDAPRTSCCHDQDCAPTASRFVNNRWEAERNGIWIPIPSGKVEQERDSPDGRSHLCGRQTMTGEFMVFCFLAGSGT